MTGDRPSPDGPVLRIGVLVAEGTAERAMVASARTTRGVRVQAIGSPDPARARALAKRLHVPDAGDADRLLQHPDVDLVVVALPPVLHAEWAVRALETGKHVLLEKSLSANGTTAALIAETAAATGRRAFVGLRHRLHPFTLRLLEHLTSGVLGALERVDVDFGFPRSVVRPGSTRLEGDLGGGAFADLGCFAIDLLRAAWGEPTVVSATSVPFFRDPRVDLQTDVDLTLPVGAPARVRASFVADADDDRRTLQPVDTAALRPADGMVLRATGAAAALDVTGVLVPQRGATLRVTAPSGVLEERAAAGEGADALLLTHIAAALLNGAPSILDADRHVGTMRIVDAVYLAAGLQPR